MHHRGQLEVRERRLQLTLSVRIIVGRISAHYEVDQVAVLVHGAPEILALTVDRDEDFVQEPRIAESTLSALQPPGVVGAKLPAPLSNGFVRHDDASLGQQILDIPEAQTVSVVQPHGVADDFRRKAMPKVAGSSRVHPGIVSCGELT